MPVTPIILTGTDIRLEPLAAHHKEGLRAACEADPHIWDIFPVCMIGEHFDSWWTATENWAQNNARVPHAVVTGDGTIIGTTSYYRWPDTPPDTVCVGGTYYAPAWRGGAVNPQAKLLLMDRAFDLGLDRILFHVDARNARSQAAMRKLGAREAGMLLQHMTTWNGHVRDTVCFDVARQHWPDIRQRLAARAAGKSSQ